MRPYDSYTPPQDLDVKLDDIFKKIRGTVEPNTKFENLGQKFDLCMACAKEFDRAIPNSVLHNIETLNDVKNFYQTPVDNVTPLDKMRNMELPENLHIQFEYHRFHPGINNKFTYLLSKTNYFYLQKLIQSLKDKLRLTENLH